MEPIKGIIIRILSPTRVVINRGFADGVRPDMAFVIYDEGEPLQDPDTREILERMEIIKGRIYIQHTQERVSIATTVSPNSDNGTVKRGAGPDAAGAVSSPNLHVAPGNIEPVPAGDLAVRRGDKVRSISN